MMTGWMFQPFKDWRYILRKFQKLIKLTQKWKDFKNNGTTWKLVSIPFKWVPMLWGFLLES
jgi:hypothetical protein